jgi:hypothetical protein
MSTIVVQPFLIFYDRSGQPLDAGYIYIGTPGINPEVSPITVYWDSSLTTTAAQPIRTLNGYASRDGSPSNIIASQSPYSILIRDRTGALVYSDLNFTAPAYAFTQTITATAGQTLFNLSASYNPGSNDLQVYVNGLLMQKTADYTETSSTSLTFTSGLSAGDEVTVLIRS